MMVFERWVEGLKGVLDEIEELEGDVQERIRVNGLVVGAVEAKAKL